MSVIDTASNTVVATGGCRDRPQRIAGITPNGAFAYVTNEISNNVSVIDTASNTVAATVPVGGNPFGVATTRRRLVVTNTNDSGPGSLRQVILDARDNVPSVITFDPLVFPATIFVQSELPALTGNGDSIDGHVNGARAGTLDGGCSGTSWKLVVPTSNRRRNSGTSGQC